MWWCLLRDSSSRSVTLLLPRDMKGHTLDVDLSQFPGAVLSAPQSRPCLCIGACEHGIAREQSETIGLREHPQRLLAGRLPRHGVALLSWDTVESPGHIGSGLPKGTRQSNAFVAGSW